MENSRMWAQVCPHSVSYQTGSVFTFIIDLAFDQLKSATWRKSESVFSARRPLAKLHKSLALTLHPSITCWPSLPKYDQDFQHGSSPLQDVPGTEEVPEDQLVRLGGEGEDAHLQGLPHLLRRGQCIIIIYIFRPLNSQSILWNYIFSQQIVNCGVCGKLTEDGDYYREHLVKEHNATEQVVEELFNRHPIWEIFSLCYILFSRSEDGSTEDLVTCTVCELDVEEGDGYRIHLKDIHNISMEDIEQMD